MLNNRREVSFELAAYDASRPLIIDPQLVYATYLGGSGSDYIGGIAVNGSGNVYVVGDTTSPDFPRTKTIGSSPNGLSHVFVTKFKPSGSGLVYSTYIAGTSNDFAAGIDNFGGGLTYAGGIAIDTNGNAFITGATASPNFPTTSGAFQAGNNGGFSDAFVTKLGPFGTNLLYASYLGGAYDDGGDAIAADNNGNAYIAGDTYSIGTGNGPFPTVPNNVFQNQPQQA